jgi:hypothetical protein
MNQPDDTSQPWVPPSEVWNPQGQSPAVDPYYEDPYNPDPYSKM